MPHLRSVRKDVGTYVLDTDQGIGVASPMLPHEPVDVDSRSIPEMGFEHLDKHRTYLLGLRKPYWLYRFLSQCTWRQASLGEFRDI